MQQPETVAGYPAWRPAGRAGGVAFVGRGETRDRREILRLVTGIERPIAWLRQMHGANGLEARAGCSGEADALTTTRRDLALAISTADCVPIVLMGTGRVTAVHAGWRGIIGRVVARAVDQWVDRGDPPTAWIGPAIGPCCYEVGPEVADRVSAASHGARVVDRDTPAGRPRLDLVASVERQLQRAGVDHIEVVRACTRCRRELHSYRRDGPAAGRNLTFAWLGSADDDASAG
jgi:YfiH family protein